MKFSPKATVYNLGSDSWEKYDLYQGDCKVNVVMNLVYCVIMQITAL